MQTKTEVRTLYSQNEVEQAMIREGLTPSPFPVLPVEIQFQDGKMMNIREQNVLGMDDEAAPDEKQFIVKVVRPIAM